MLFNSLSFLIFLPIVVLIYFIVPKRLKNIWLLIASYYFYMCWNAKYIVLIFTSTLVTYVSALLIDRVGDGADNNKKAKKWILAACFLINLGILFLFKYLNFFIGTITDIAGLIRIQINIPTFDVLLPVGISFYSFQALGYIVDVYRGDIKAERNFIQYALFVSFFPQLVAGPIERSKNLLGQLGEVHKFKYENLVDGIMLMIWGFFLKLVIADRAAMYVDTIYSDIHTYGGMYFVIAAIIFCFQIYCDFYGYSIIAKGSAKILGIELMENFYAPFLSTSTTQMWTRWHISLTSWFRDYLYIPLGGNRKGIVRKYLNILIIFVTSGLWHGANITYVLWGFLSGVFEIIEALIEPYRRKINEKFHLNRENFIHKLILILFSFGMFALFAVFFRASSVMDACYGIKSVFTVRTPGIFSEGKIFECGLNRANFILLIIAIVVLMIADICKVNKIELRKVILARKLPVRSLIIAGAILVVLVFGIWGNAYNANSFIYFQF